MVRRNWIPIAIFVIVTLSILIPRLGMPYFFCDIDQVIYIENAPSSLESNTWLDYPGRYRYLPIDVCRASVLLRLSPDSTTIPATTQAITIGILAIMIYLLTMKLTRNKFASLGSAFLCIFSLGNIQVTWLALYTHGLVELAIVTGLYAYICYRNTGRHRWLYLLFGCAIVSPLMREVAIALPIVALLVTIADRKWDKKLLIPLPLLLLHNIFPSTLPSLFFGKLIAIPVFARGVPEAYSLFSPFNLEALRFSMPIHLLLFIPPVLTLLAIVSIILHLIRKNLKAAIVAGVAGLVLITGFASIFFTNMDFGDDITILSTLPAILCLAVAIASYRYNKLLSIWFIVAWIPFFWLWNASNPTLVASAIPWTIMIAIWLSKLPVVEQLSEKGKTFFLSLRPRQLIQYTPLLILLIMGFISQPLNIIAVHDIYNETISKSEEVASWLTTNAPEDSIVITNSVHMRDLEHYTGNYRFEFYPSSKIGKYRTLVKECNSQDIYVLIILSRTDGEKAWLINDPNNLAELQAKFQVVCRYPTLDPLKSLLPEHYRPRGGLPDAARETRISAGLFWQETFVEHGLYKVIKGNEAK